MDQFEQTGRSVIGVKPVPMNETERYGIVEYSEKNGLLSLVDRFIEKPTPGTTQSNLAIMGRYVLTPDIFKFLQKQEKGAGGEIQLTDAIQKLNESQGVYAYEFEGKRYDVGEKLGFITTTLDFALRNESLKGPLLEAMKEILQRELIHKSN